MADTAGLRGRLLEAGMLTPDAARAILGTTEPLEDITFMTGPQGGWCEEPFAADPADLRVRYGPGWRSEQAQQEPTSPTGAWLRLAGLGWVQMTFQCAQQLGSTARINQRYQVYVPPLTCAGLTEWALAAGMGERELKLLLAGYGTGPDGDRCPLAVAQTRKSVMPFSNLEILDTLLAAAAEAYGDEAAGTALVDYKMSHDLEKTVARVVFPAVTEPVAGSGVDGDAWLPGIEWHNSCIGLTKTTLSGYMFRVHTTAGVPDLAHAAGGFARRGSKPGDAYAWVAENAALVLAGLDEAFAGLQALVRQPLADDVVIVLGDLFERYHVPKNLRLQVVSGLEERPAASMYDLLGEIAGPANMPGQPWRAVGDLQRMGGQLVKSAGARCSQDHPCLRLLPEDYDFDESGTSSVLEVT